VRRTQKKQRGEPHKTTGNPTSKEGEFAQRVDMDVENRLKLIGVQKGKGRREITSLGCVRRENIVQDGERDWREEHKPL